MSAELSHALALLDERLERALDAFGARRNDPFRGLYLSEDDVRETLHVESFRRARVAWEPIAAGVPVLAHIGATFGLDAFELDALLVTLAPELDLRYERVYAFLQDDVTRRRPSLDLVLALQCRSRDEAIDRRCRLVRGPLLEHGLVSFGDPERPLLARSLFPDAGLVRLAGGDDGLDPRLEGYAELELSPVPSAAAVVVGDLPTVLPLRLALVGRSGEGQRNTARALARTLGRSLLACEFGGVVDVGSLLAVARRDAALRRAVLFVDGSDDPGSAIAGSLPDAIVVSARERVRGALSLQLPRPTAAARRAVWASALTGTGVSRRDVAEVAARFELPLGQIEAAARDSRVAAATRGQRPTRGDLFSSARAHSYSGLGDLAQRIEPARAWNDLVLPEEQVEVLRELCRRVAHRHRVLEDWGFAARLSGGRGTTSLFSGAPGTGKSLAAEVVAGELGLDLYRIDLSGVVSKYIGETEKNLDRIFRRAETRTPCSSSTKPTRCSASARRYATRTTATRTSRSPTCCRRWRRTRDSRSSRRICATTSTRPSCAAWPSSSPSRSPRKRSAGGSGRSSGRPRCRSRTTSTSARSRPSTA